MWNYACMIFLFFINALTCCNIILSALAILIWDVLQRCLIMRYLCFHYLFTLSLKFHILSLGDILICLSLCFDFNFEIVSPISKIKNLKSDLFSQKYIWKNSLKDFHTMCKIDLSSYEDNWLFFNVRLSPQEVQSEL